VQVVTIAPLDIVTEYKFKIGVCDVEGAPTDGSFSAYSSYIISSDGNLEEKLSGELQMMARKLDKTFRRYEEQKDAQDDADEASLAKALETIEEHPEQRCKLTLDALRRDEDSRRQLVRTSMHALELSNMISEKMKKLTELKNDYTKVLEDNCRIRLPADIESLAEEYAEAYRNANANESRLQEQMKIPPKYDFGEPKDSFDARKEQHAKTIGSALNVVHATQKNLKDIDANLKSSFEAAKPAIVKHAGDGTEAETLVEALTNAKTTLPEESTTRQMLSSTFLQPREEGGLPRVTVKVIPGIIPGIFRSTEERVVEPAVASRQSSSVDAGPASKKQKH